MPRTFYLIDGYAHIYRAYFAPFGNLTAPSGEPTRATHVFMQMVFNILRDKRPDYLAVALDVSDETVFRKQYYAEYKAHREPPPEDLPPQRDRILSILETAGVPLLRRQGFEADDLMATLARRLAADDFTIVFVSKDKDLEQCLSANVHMYDPAKDLTISPEVLFELKGWRPEQAIEVQCLMGDSTDNVPGVKGIGPKTAAKLIESYGSAAGVIANADKLTPKQRENVLAFAPLLETTRKLITLADDVPLEFDVETARPGRFNWSAVRPIFEELGIRRLMTQMPGGATSDGGDDSPRATPQNVSRSASVAQKGKQAKSFTPSPADASSGLFDEFEEPPSAEQERGAGRAARGETSLAARADSQERRALRERAARLRDPVSGRYELVDSLEGLDRLVESLRSSPAFVIDVETTTVHPIDSDLVGVAISNEVGRGWYLPVRSMYGEPLPLEGLRSRLGPLLADEKIVKIGHHIKFDLNVLRGAGMPARGPLFDTMIATFCLDPMQLSFGLKRLSQLLFDHDMITIEDVIGKGRDQLRIDQAPLEHVAEYAGEDADYTYRLFLALDPVIRSSPQNSLFFDVEMPLVRVLADMEFEGVNLDAEFLARMSVELGRRIDALSDEALAMAGRSINLDSPRQLADLLFDELGFRVVKRTRTARSTDADALETLARETGHPLPAKILEYRELQKLRGTYVDALPAARARRTGRIHTSFHQTGAITGRLSSSDPNLQNIPIRADVGRQIRRAFIPRTPEERLIVADYSQIELRVLAHFSGDESLIQAFSEDRDVHAFVAAQVNGVPLEAVTGEMRSRAKAVNFGIVYGQTAFGLAQGTGMARGEAQQFIDDYFGRYPRVRTFIEDCIADARRRGWVETMLGRRRPLPDIDSRNRAARSLSERLAVNTVIQGSAADLIKLAMNALHDRVLDESLPLRMLLQVHDELVCEAPAARADEMAAIVAETMRSARVLRVPLKVDVATGQNWLEAK